MAWEDEATPKQLAYDQRILEKMMRRDPDVPKRRVKKWRMDQARIPWRIERAADRCWPDWDRLPAPSP